MKKVIASQTLLVVSLWLAVSVAGWGISCQSRITTAPAPITSPAPVANTEPAPTPTSPSEPAPAVVPAPSSEPVPATLPTPSSEPTPTPTLAPTAVVEITVSVSYPSFQPSVITVAKGQTVRLIITSTDTSHTFTIDELGINLALNRGQTVAKELTVDKAGVFTFYCAVPGHRSAGMRGTFTVTDGSQPATTPEPTPTPKPEEGNGDGYGY